MASHDIASTIESISGVHDVFVAKGGRLYRVDHKDRQDPERAKASWLRRLGCPPDTPIVQVVGNSTMFSEEGFAYLKSKLFPKLEELSRHVIEYGYTRKREGDARGCINAAAEMFYELRPDRHVIGCAVDFHTPVAIREWGCGVCPFVKNIQVVAGGARFGGDLPTTDGMMDALIVGDGGIQSLSQAMNALARGLRVYYIVVARGEHDSQFVSAAELLDALCDLSPFATEEEARAFVDGYLAEKTLFDRNNKDADTKQALFDDAMEIFYAQRLWSRVLDLCEEL